MFASVRLQHFRSYDDASFEFSPEVTIVVGPNAAGKTNLLESLLLLSLGGSYRASDKDLLQHGSEWARLDATATDGGSRSLKLIMAPTSSGQMRSQKQFIIDDISYKRLDFSKRLPVVLFEPEHLRLLNGSPERRRDFIDELLSQLTAEYGTTLRQCQRVLLQRNALLKQSHIDRDELFVWNIRLSQLAEKLVRARTDFVLQQSDELQNLYSSIAGKESQVTMRYHSSLPWADGYAQRLLKVLELSLKTDRERGYTTSGPHRDDLQFELHGKPAGVVASRGEARSLVLALKLIELSLLHKKRGIRPLMLLDDVFSELDGARRQALTSLVANYQTIITTTDADAVVAHFSSGSCALLAL